MLVQVSLLVTTVVNAFVIIISILVNIVEHASYRRSGECERALFLAIANSLRFVRARVRAVSVMSFAGKSVPPGFHLESFVLGVFFIRIPVVLHESFPRELPKRSLLKEFSKKVFDWDISKRAAQNRFRRTLSNTVPPKVSPTQSFLR